MQTFTQCNAAQLELMTPLSALGITSTARIVSIGTTTTTAAAADVHGRVMTLRQVAIQNHKWATADRGEGRCSRELW